MTLTLTKEELGGAAAGRDQTRALGAGAGLENIAVNARDAMPGRGTFTIETEQHGDVVVIRSSDTGTGIASKARDRVFAGGFTTKTAGHGLGLESVRSFVESHGGTVAVESEPRAGTTFTLTLPRARRYAR